MAKVNADPVPIARRDGCKVSWETFRTLREARVRAKSARKQANALELKGFDWGFQSPGQIRKVDNGYEVTCP